MEYCVIRGGKYCRVKRQEIKINFIIPQEITGVIIKGKVHAVVPADKTRIQF